MFNKNLSTTHKLTISALTIALYVVVMMLTQSFAFGQYQIRIATALYGLSAIFPFLIVPMAIANIISNTIMGGLGPLDIIGGGCVGFISASLIVLVQRFKLNKALIGVIITLVPGLGVPLWLSYLLHLPYVVLAMSLVVGQIIPGIVGTALVVALEKRSSTVGAWRENKA